MGEQGRSCFPAPEMGRSVLSTQCASSWPGIAASAWLMPAIQAGCDGREPPAWLMSTGYSGGGDHELPA